MTKTKILLLLATMVVAASCTPVDVPPPMVTPQGDDQFLIDPRIGTTVPPELASRFEAMWRHLLAGNEAEARRRLTEIFRTHPDFAPAVLAEAALDIRAGRYDAARDAIARVPDSLPARVYTAEIAYRQQQTREALDLYRAIAAQQGAPPFAAERAAQLQEALFAQTFAEAKSASDAEAVRLLREALALNAGALEARILLGQRLVAQKQFDEARRELEPLLDTAADRTEVQEMLAEIDAGRGRYQEAIVRYDRLARRTKEPRYERRLEEIKQEWSSANMPSHYRMALDSPALTRAELATLLYWTVPAVRFAQNLPSPPIAVDVEGLAGREEMVRAIAIGMYDVDPVTRRVSPSRQITAARLSTHLARVLMMRGASCARGLSSDRVLAACAVSELARDPDDVVTGREAQAALVQVAKAL